jgi:lipoprotein-anchoring transpeptidase ErfK/SrfK
MPVIGFLNSSSPDADGTRIQAFRGARNPMGPRALTLAGDEYAIHGTNRPESIGKFASYGCIRMYNEDILDLFDRVSIGTQVIVMR